jgi:hypothetical protein
VYVLLRGRLSGIGEPEVVTASRPDGAAIVLAASAGVVAAFSAPQATGNPTVDLALVATSVALVTLAGWWVPKPIAGAGALVIGAFTVTIIGATVGLLAFAASMLVTGNEPRRKSLLTVAIVGLAMNLSVRSSLGGFMGASALAGSVLAVVFIVYGIRGQSRRGRRVLGAMALGAVGLAAIATTALGLGAVSSVDDLRDGNRLAREALASLGDGDIRAAQASFTAAGTAFGSAERRFGTPWLVPAQLIPVVAQHHRAAREATSGAARASRAVEADLEQIDLTDLTRKPGALDLDAIRRLEAPLADIRANVVQLHDELRDADSPWLIGPARDRLAEFTEELGEQVERSDDVIDIVRRAPALLGANRPRVYFLAFTTPSEARGLGGFTGNWAEVTVDDGKIRLTDSGRSDELDERGFSRGARVLAPDDWVSRYGKFGLTTGSDGTVGAEAWKNITMSPSMASTGQVMADLYEQAGGQTVDGVFALDVFTLADLLHFTGPIALPDSQRRLAPENAAEFLLHDQYLVTDKDERVDLLEAVARGTIDALLSGTLPEPSKVLERLGPRAAEGRLAGYATDPDDQALLERVGLDGTFADPGDHDGIAVVLNNAGGSKIDFFMNAAADYHVIADTRTNTASATLDVTLRNLAPTAGEPRYVTGNLVGLPDGYSRTYVSLYTKLPVDGIAVDGSSVTSEQGLENGYFVTSVFVDLSAGESAAISLQLSGPLDLTDGYTLTVRSPPTVTPVPIDVSVGSTGREADVDTWSFDTPGRFSVDIPSDQL